MLSTDTPTPCMQNPPELWFSTDAGDQKLAKALCLECPVVLQCLHDALETEALMGKQIEGIHGATTKRERARFESMKRTA